MCEKYLYYYQQQYGIPYVALRYANVYGPRQNPHGEAGVVAVFINKMLNGEQPIINGDGKQTRDYVYIDDVVEANRLALMQSPLPLGERVGVRGRIYNVGTGIETNVNTIFRALRELTGSTCQETHGPAKPGEQLRSSVSPSRLERELGWRVPTPFADGMRKTVEWFRSSLSLQGS